MGWTLVKTLMCDVHVDAQFVFVFLWVVWGFMVTLLLEYGLENVNLATYVFASQECHSLT